MSGGSETILIECAACHELNRRGTQRCARCGESLGSNLGGVDPELTSFRRSMSKARQELIMENVAKKRFVLGDHPGVDEVLPAALPGLDCGSSNPRIVAGNAVLDGPLFNPPPNRPARDPDSFTRETGASTLVECAACHELNP